MINDVFIQIAIEFSHILIFNAMDVASTTKLRL